MRAKVEYAAVALGALLGVLAPAHALQVGVDTLAEVQRAAGTGDFAAAERCVRAEPDQGVAARAEVWLEFRARNFDAAFEAAERGLAREPTDLWLAERASACALWVRDPWRARSALTRFSAIMASASPADREPFAEALAQAQVATQEIVASAERAQSAKSRARACALAILAGVAVLLGWIGSGLRRAGP